MQSGEWPFCKGVASDHQASGSYNVQGDEIDVSIRHALCNPDGSPRRFRSRSELKRVEREHGWTNYVQHIGARGSDKSPHTVKHVSVPLMGEKEAERVRRWHEHEKSLVAA